jgi:hypothetical protein
LIEWTLDTMLQNLNSSYASILGTDTYTSLLQAYQDTTGNIYDYYGWKQSLTKYLKDNWYFVSNGVQTTQKKQAKAQTSTQTTTGTIVSYVVTKALNNVIAKYKLK